MPSLHSQCCLLGYGTNHLSGPVVWYSVDGCKTPAMHDHFNGVNPLTVVGLEVEVNFGGRDSPVVMMALIASRQMRASCNENRKNNEYGRLHIAYISMPNN